jgi:hypothetical protein
MVDVSPASTEHHDGVGSSLVHIQEVLDSSLILETSYPDSSFS